MNIYDVLRSLASNHGSVAWQDEARKTIDQAERFDLLGKAAYLAATDKESNL